MLTGYDSVVHSADNQHIGRAKDRLTCRGCGYALRGLPGVHVRCPECGRMNHVLHALSRRRSDWSSNRLYVGLSRAGLAGVVTILGWVMIAVVDWPTVVMFPASVIALAMTVFWGMLIRRAVAGFASVGQGIGLVVAMLGIMMVYMACLLTVLAVMFFALPMTMLMGGLVLDEPADLAWVAMGLLVPGAIAVVIVWVAYRGDRWVGAACLRQSITAAGGTEGVMPDAGKR